MVDNSAINACVTGVVDLTGIEDLRAIGEVVGPSRPCKTRRVGASEFARADFRQLVVALKHSRQPEAIGIASEFEWVGATL